MSPYMTSSSISGNTWIITSLSTQPWFTQEVSRGEASQDPGRWKGHNQSCLSTCGERVHHPMQIACKLRVVHHGDMGFLCKQIGCCIGSRGLKVWTKINGGRDAHNISVCFFEDKSHNAFLFENPSWSQSRWHRFASCWSVSGCFWHHIWSIRIPAHPLILVGYFLFF